tara:strand:+ start:107 stop:496 length:390 start_codon:yes stop_codon:yes gene_type:complete
MKFVLALIGASSAITLSRRSYPGVTFIQTQDDDNKHGNGSFNGWRNPWPLGIDDSTNDHLIMNWMKDPKGPDAPIKYHDKMRQWVPGTWPVNFNWNGGWTQASYNNQIDDGTDDNEVIDLQTRTNNIHH